MSLSDFVESKVVGYHVTYEQDYPSALGRYGGLLYVVATVAPPFVSRIKRTWMLGATVLISYLITTVLYTDYIVSVWCFIASIISKANQLILEDCDRILRVECSDDQIDITGIRRIVKDFGFSADTLADSTVYEAVVTKD